MTRLTLTGIIATLLAGLDGCLLTGCAMPAFPKEISQAAQTIAVSMGDQAMWQNLNAHLRGHINNPGIRGYVGVLYVAGGNLEGVDGDMNLEGEGVGSGELSAEARAKIISLIKSDTEILHEAIEAIKTPPPPATKTEPTGG